MTTSPDNPRRRPWLAIAVIAVLASTAAACGSGSSGGSGAPANATNGYRTSPQQMSSVNGKIASVGSEGVAVDTSGGSANVAFGGTTQFSSMSKAARADVKVGDCVSVTSNNRSFGAAKLTAVAVSITGTTCPSLTRASGLPGGTPPGGEAPSGGTPPRGGEAPGGGPATGTPPAGTPGGTGARRGFGGAIGTVIATSGRTIVLKSTNGTRTTVTTSDDTTYSTRHAAKKSDAVTGKCLSAFGQKSGTTLDARSVTISSPTGGSCRAFAAGLGGFGGFGAPGAAPHQTSSGLNG